MRQEACSLRRQEEQQAQIDEICCSWTAESAGFRVLGFIIMGRRVIKESKMDYVIVVCCHKIMLLFYVLYERSQAFQLSRKATVPIVVSTPSIASSTDL